MVLAAFLCTTLNGGTGIFDAALDGDAGVLEATLDGGAGIVDAVVWFLALEGLGGSRVGLPAEDALLALVGHVGEDCWRRLVGGELLNPYLARQMTELWDFGYPCSSTGLRVNLGVDL